MEKYVCSRISPEYLFQKSPKPNNEYFEHLLLHFIHPTNIYYIGKGDKQDPVSTPKSSEMVGGGV